MHPPLTFRSGEAPLHTSLYGMDVTDDGRMNIPRMSFPVSESPTMQKRCDILTKSKIDSELSRRRRKPRSRRADMLGLILKHDVSGKSMLIYIVVIDDDYDKAAEGGSSIRCTSYRLPNWGPLTKGELSSFRLATLRHRIFNFAEGACPMIKIETSSLG